MKRVISLILTCCLLLACLPMAASAATSGTCGSVSWSFNTSTGKLTISGTGEMDFGEDGYWGWEDYQEQILSVVIGEGVTSVGFGAFSYCENLSSVSLPSTLRYIDSFAFEDCYGLSAVTLPEGLESIYDYAFGWCYGLTSIHIPASVEYISNTAFYKCDSMTKYTVASGNPYYSADSKGVLFSKDKTVLYNAPHGLSGGYSVPYGVLAVNSYAFYNCDYITGLYLPATVEELYYYCFECCDSLQNIWVSADNQICSSDSNGLLYNKSKSALWNVPGGKTGTVKIADTVTYIDNMAMYDCTEVTEVILPKGLIEIGELVFSGCYSLETVSLPSTVDYIGYGAFYGCFSLREIVIPEGVTTIGEDTFNCCFDLESVTIPGTVTSIGDRAFFGCDSLTSVSIPEGVTHIGRYAFSSCVSLEELLIPESVEYIDMAVCSDSEKFSTVRYAGSKEQWQQIEIDADNEELLSATIVYGKHTNRFTDVVESKYYYDAVMWAVENNITSGTGDGTTFSPNEPCTRGQVVTFLWRAAGKPEPTSTENPFSDLDTSKYYYKAVLWAVENGITSGYKDGTFQPDRTCSRAEIVTFLYRYAGKPPVTNTGVSYSDVNASAYYYNPVLWANENEIVFGYSDGTFRPGDTCTRGQIAAFLYRYKV